MNLSGRLPVKKIKIAIVGIGNCASSLIQGIEYYKDKNNNDAIGLMHWDIGGYKPYDIEVVAAFDIDKRKVGKDISQAIFELPNCTKIICDKIPLTGVKVMMGNILDGISDHMGNYDSEYTFSPSDKKEATKEDIINSLKESGAIKIFIESVYIVLIILFYSAFLSILQF